MIVCTKGIVLHRTKYSDNSLIVKVFTEKFGTQSFMIKSAFSKKSKVNYTQFAPLSLVELNFNSRKTGQLQYIKEITFYYHFITIPFDIVKNSILIFYSELIYKALYSYGEDKRLYRYIEESIIALDKHPRVPADIHLRFLVELCEFLGFAPHANFTEKECHFCIQDASFTSWYSDNGDFLSVEASRYLNYILQSSEKETSTLPSKQIRNELLHALVKYLEIHNEGIKKIESIEILAQILN